MYIYSKKSITHPLHTLPPRILIFFTFDIVCLNVLGHLTAIIPVNLVHEVDITCFPFFLCFHALF